MTELEINRASHMIDPHLHIWGWEIPVYLFLGGLTAGLMILVPLLWGRSSPDERSRWARRLLLAAPLLISVGMLALFLDLAYKVHVYRFFLTFEWTSPMSWGSWILIAIYPVMIMLGLAGLDDRDATALGRWKPLAVLRLGGLLARARQLGQSRESFLRHASIVLGVALGGYTGLLLGTLGARHVWSSAALGPLFLVSGISTGAALLMLFPLTGRERRFVRDVDVGAILVELGLIAVYLLGLATSGATGRAAAGLFLGGEYTALFWSLVVVAGLAVPLVLELVELRRHLRPTMVAPVLLLIGGLSLRWILVAAGQA
jgi:formate-dependent nitrite reductase membrane component NrfD